MAGLDGGLQQRLNPLRSLLLDQLAELEARVDFEEDLPPLDGATETAHLRVELQSAAQLTGTLNQIRTMVDVLDIGRTGIGS